MLRLVHMARHVAYPVPFQVSLWQDGKRVSANFPFPELPPVGLQFVGSTVEGVGVRWVVRTVVVDLKPDDTGAAWLAGDYDRSTMAEPMLVRCEVDAVSRWDDELKEWTPA